MAFRTLVCKAEMSANAKATNGKSAGRRAQRLETLKTDLRMIYDHRVAGVMTIDMAFRDVFKKEFEMRKQLVDKWVAIAKEDSEHLSAVCKAKKEKFGKKCEVDADVVEGEVVGNGEREGERDVKVSSEAFYEPWVIDD